MLADIEAAMRADERLAAGDVDTFSLNYGLISIQENNQLMSDVCQRRSRRQNFLVNRNLPVGEKPHWLMGGL